MAAYTSTFRSPFTVPYIEGPCKPVQHPTFNATVNDDVLLTESQLDELFGEGFVQAGRQPIAPDSNAPDTPPFDPSIVDHLFSGDDNFQSFQFGQSGEIDQFDAINGAVGLDDSIMASLLAENLQTSHLQTPPPSPPLSTHPSGSIISSSVHTQNVQSSIGAQQPAALLPQLTPTFVHCFPPEPIRNNGPSHPSRKPEDLTFVFYDPKDPNKHEPCEKILRSPDELSQQRVDAAALREVGGAFKESTVLPEVDQFGAYGVVLIHNGCLCVFASLCLRVSVLSIFAD
ncbi:uncharacterized protein N7515_003589 [Penicillium bovifimosum]|uniref:Uncharacterized protein n=1 Tax=Penicillium bovifimosum TaxID=126998 RepID=A0A9W9H6T5_9EURO|nr:uncharacterized protein N7515_003589 [Penicillium bovifimosum]KAJ5138741.1 hypothetical protein N7515_003589 [Penicillium bovifimosum]